jgi:oligopeptide/dipeptide ABC transporter ATP-binding protein
VNGGLLKIENLKVNFYTYRGIVQALDDVNLEIEDGETCGLVGETGCGKSVTALSILGLIRPPGRIVGGKILFKGKNLLEENDNRLRKIRGKEISMIFQEVTPSLNPVLTIGSQMTDVIMLHQELGKEEAERKALELLKMVRIGDCENKFRAYPHELSDGMNQRVMIAMALSATPLLLIADEPTTALDVTTQAQILWLIRNLKATYMFATLLVTHNLGIVAENCDKVVVMYSGQIVEQGSTEELFSNPRHPYTIALLKCIPSSHGSRLFSIGGLVPSLINPPPGCRFNPRCQKRKSICKEKRPEMTVLEKTHSVACHLCE